MEELFDRSAEYDEMLNKGIALSGEDKYFFIRARFGDLINNIPKSKTIKKILDFGCGVGDGTLLMKQYFPDTAITGCDTASKALEYANQKNSANGTISYIEMKNFLFKNEFDLCFVNGVFHHIPLEQRPLSIKMIYDSLKPGGILALFENNPLNPGTKMVMSRIAFDKDAITLVPSETRQMLLSAGFKIKIKPRFLFYFPRVLKYLRPLEQLLVHIPFGAQYYFLAEK
ncbi:MAG: class I SAM-dependent methyltransferase [Bacteroidetes bacterium]|nr:class I SAM-dependent methyltransferase [Bacteroidota bacterium]